MKNIKDILKIADAFLELVTQKIMDTISKVDTEEAKKYLLYAINQKGQMIRPSLIYITACALKPNLEAREKEKLVNYAAAIELLHTASLMHDDILDTAEERRGMKSLYSAFGTGKALLTGNIFYLNAFDIASSTLDRFQMESIIHAATDMCCGEIVQLSNSNKRISEDVYIEIIGKKTASLIKYACKESARIIGMDEDTVTEMQNLGEYLGILYQLTDDLKDGDVLHEQGFDFEFHVSNYIAKAQGIIKKFNDSPYKRIFEELLNYYSHIIIRADSNAG